MAIDSRVARRVLDHIRDEDIVELALALGNIDSPSAAPSVPKTAGVVYLLRRSVT